VISPLTRQGGRLWLAVLVVSVLLAAAAVWVLAVGSRGYVVAGAESGDPSELSLPATQPSPVSSASAREGQRDDKVPVWPTHQATTPPAHGSRAGSPRQLAVPRLSMEMPIVPTKVDGAGAMALPPKPTEIGWYAYGPRPGDPEGSAVLGGHLDSREYGIGPLAVLRRLRNGDVIVVRTTTGRQTFRVTSIRMIRKQALPLRTLFDRDGQRRLRIVTCGGPYIRSRGGYQDNLVVTAIPDAGTPSDRRAPHPAPGKVQG
jgi:sortase family protein